MTCTSCDEVVAADAGWCGACGARVVADDEPQVDVVAAGGRGVGRWVTVVVLVGALAAALAAAALRPRPAEVLLGRVGNGTGITASALPPQGLQLAWSHDLPDDVWWGDPGSLVAEDGLVGIGGRVVDLATGDMERIVNRRHRQLEATGARLSGRELVLVDELRGVALGRVELPDRLFGAPVWPAGRWGDVTYLAGDEGVAFVRDDGSVVAELPGWHDDWEGWGSWDAAAVALRSDLETQGPSGDVRLVSVTTGQTLLAREEPDEAHLLTSNVGDRVLLATTPTTLSPDVTTPPWEIELIDARTGEVLVRADVASLGAPRIVGRTADGGTLLRLESEFEIEIWEAPTDRSPLRLRTTVARPTWPTVTHDTGRLLDTAGLADGGLLVQLVAPDRVEARTLDGRVVWEEDVLPSGALLVAGDVAALLPPHPHDGAPDPVLDVRLLDVRDGASLGTVRTTPWLQDVEWGHRPAAVVNGAVAIAHRTGPGATAPADLGGARWIELATGRIRTHSAVFEPWVDDRNWQPDGLVLAGLVARGETGRSEPIVVSGYEAPFRLLVDGAVVEHDLPGLDRRPDHLQPLGATSGHLAIATEAWDGDGNGQWATHVVDRASGGTVTLPGTTGRFLTDDLLVGTEPAPSGWAVEERLVAHDPATGELRWEGPLLPSRHRDLLHDEDLAVIGDEFRRTAVALTDGSVPWSHAPDEELLPGGVLGPDHLLLATTTGEVYALDRDTGEEVWRSDVGAPVTSLTGAGGGALVTTLAADLVVLDGSGTAVQRIQLDEPALHAAALGDTVVVQHRASVIGLHPDGAGHTADDEVELP